MRRGREIFLLGMLALSLTAGCSDGEKKEVQAEPKISPIPAQQISNEDNSVAEELKYGFETQMNGRKFEDSIANYFGELTFLTEEEKARLLQEEKEWTPMLKRYNELDEEIMGVHEDYYFHYAPLLSEYTWANMRRVQAWNKYASLDSATKKDGDIRAGIEESDEFTKEEKEQLRKDEETLDRLRSEVQKVENAIEVATKEAEKEKHALMEKMRAIHLENQEIWNKIREEYGKDLSYFPDEFHEQPLDLYLQREPRTPNRKMEELEGSWREDDGFIRSMRDITESIENFFPKLTFLTEDEKKVLIAEESEWKALLSEMDRLQREIVKIYSDHEAKHPELYEKHEEMIRKNMDLRWKMDRAAFVDREWSEEEKIRKSTILTEEEKELLLKDQAVIDELEAKIRKHTSIIREKVEPLDRQREELSEKIDEIHEKNRAIWDKILKEGWRLEISTGYLPPIDSEEWFQKK